MVEHTCNGESARPQASSPLGGASKAYIFTTATHAAGGQIPADRVIDGVDLMPYVNGEREAPPHDTLFWRQGHHQVVLHQGHKLIVTDLPDRFDVSAAPTRKRWLFDLSADATEQRNLADEQPQRVAMLERLLADHNAEQVAPMWPSVIDSPQLGWTATLGRAGGLDLEALRNGDLVAAHALRHTPCGGRLEFRCSGGCRGGRSAEGADVFRP